MEDKELLAAAAKAAGIKGEYCEYGLWVLNENYEEEILNDENSVIGDYWNPLRDDGDALRLAVKLEMFDLDRLLVDLDIKDAKTATNRDPYEATRRAIVLAASKVLDFPSNKN